MPELPEVETTVRDLRKRIMGLSFTRLWADWVKNLETLLPVGGQKYKREKGLAVFEKELIGRKVLGLERRAKFVVLRLSGRATLLVHMKLTGHLLVGKWRLKGRKWLPEKGSPALKDRWNSYLRWVATFNNSRQLAFSDLRRFGRFRLALADINLDGSPTGIKELDELGPEPFSPQFTLPYFSAIIKKRHRPIKTVLLDQGVVAGIGNIYSDEILWHARVSPKKRSHKITTAEASRIFENIAPVLREGIAKYGATIGDYHRPDGGAGGYQNVRLAYQRTGEPCARCGTLIRRIKISGRGSHFCPRCQR